MIDTIVKRDGREMPFESDKIAQAVRKAPPVQLDRRDLPA